MIKNFDKLADRLKGITYDGAEITAEKLIELHKSEAEIELGISEGKYYTLPQETELRENLKRTGYSEGKTAGEEMTIKEIKRLKGLEFDGKNIDALITNYDNKVMSEAKIEPSTKIKELQTSLETLQSKYQSDIAMREENIKKLTNDINQIGIDNRLINDLPKLNGIKPEHALLIAKQSYQFDKSENGTIIVKQNGQILKNDIESPMDYKEVLANFAKQNGWIVGSDGRGGENQQGQYNEHKNISDLMKYMREKNIDPTSKQGLDMIASLNNKA